MKNYGKRAISFVLLFLMCVVTVFGNVNTATATEVAETEERTNEVAVLEEAGYAATGTEISHNFTVDANKEVAFVWLVPTVTDCEVAIFDSAGYVYDDGTVTTADWKYDEEYGCYFFGFYEENMPAGDYTISFVVTAPVQYILYAEATVPEVALSQTKLTITVGMKEQLTVEYTDEEITWKSSKKSVAKVNSEGVITAKKTGKATITATTESGKVLKCKVTVKANKYTQTKYTVDDLKEADLEAIVQVYSASYDSDGNLVMKCRFINNCGYKVTELENLEIVMLTDEGKVIGKYAVDSKKIVVANSSSKDFNITIKKSKLKIKKADLRNADYDTDGTYVYYY